MKKVILFLMGILYFGYSQAQDETDALRYSFLTPGGSARVQSIGGTSVSLGGDLSMANSNPATLGLFKSSELSFTPELKFSSADGNYLGSNATDNKSQFIVPQVGIVFAKPTSRNSNSNWRNVSFGLGINRVADFNQNITYSGKNDQSSYADNYLIDLINSGITDQSSPEDFQSRFPSDYAYGLGLAYSTDLFIPIADDNGNFSTWESLPGEVLSDGRSLSQTNSISSRGGINEFNLSVAGNYDDRLLLGVGLYIPNISYRRTSAFRETNTEDKDALMDYYEERNFLHTDGTGINGKVGAIYIIDPQWRVGASIHTPTLYSMHDIFSTDVTTSSSDLGTSYLATQDVTGGYPGEFDYSMTTPARFMAGVSYVVGAQAGARQHGFISLDYEYVNYGSTKFHFNRSSVTTDDQAYVKELNHLIKSMYGGGSNLRLGGEFKFDEFAARAGVMYMQSPFKDSQIKGDQLRYSVGMGFRTGGFYVDLSYIYADEGKYLDQPYTVYEGNDLGSTSPNPASIKRNNSTVLLTFGFALGQ